MHKEAGATRAHHTLPGMGVARSAVGAEGGYHWKQRVTTGSGGAGVAWTEALPPVLKVREKA